MIIMIYIFHYLSLEIFIVQASKVYIIPRYRNVRNTADKHKPHKTFSFKVLEPTKIIQ